MAARHGGTPFPTAAVPLVSCLVGGGFLWSRPRPGGATRRAPALWSVSQRPQSGRTPNEGAQPRATVAPAGTKISELARRADVTTKAVRYYESLGLIRMPAYGGGWPATTHG
ncbi:MerR family DNA-binding transcriptional regulator [Streptomyces rhizosphaericus]|uniref:MerR family DNA-binding transcriptional regulator n=2 Tax=Streptomyces TaxID=1883 RepID=UPI001FC92169|nr:MerR family DNA-binding transcriptional regulator [Streptomyces rhizosphaericus]